MSRPKTLTPTNATITYPTYQSPADMDVFNEDIGNLAEAINTIASNVETFNKSIPNGTDLNTLTKTGVYRGPYAAASVATLVNCPVSASAFILLVSGLASSTTGCTQCLITGTTFYTRSATSSGFINSWKKTSFDDIIDRTAGDIYLDNTNYTTWETIWAKITEMMPTTGDSVTCFIAPTPMSIISSNARPAGSEYYAGMMTRTGSNTFRMILTGADYIFYAFLTGTSSSTPGTYSEKRRLPYATEIEMSSSDNTTVSEAISNIYKIIPNNTDLNNLMTSGVYRSPLTTANIATLIHCPANVPFVFVVNGNGDMLGCVQLLASDGGIYVRRATSSGFSNWKKASVTAISS